MRSLRSTLSEHEPRNNDEEVIVNSIYFNVNKIYRGINSFGFESIMEINGSRGYCLKITQTEDTTLYSTDTPFQPGKLAAIVKELFDDTITSLNEHRTQKFKQNNTGVAASIIPDNVLSTYFSMANYCDLLSSCILKTDKQQTL